METYNEINNEVINEVTEVAASNMLDNAKYVGIGAAGTGLAFGAIWLLTKKVVPKGKAFFASKFGKATDAEIIDVEPADEAVYEVPEDNNK